MPAMIYNASSAAAIASITARVLKDYPEASAAIQRALADAKATTGKTADVNAAEVDAWSAAGWELAA
jgi:hypothetical protein